MDEVLQQFVDCRAILNGHFILSSGLHSDTYLQCARVLMYPHISTKLCSLLASKIKNICSSTITAVVSPAMGGVVVGYETAKQLNVLSIFCESINGIFELRRGFNLETNQQVIVVEDVVTTGKSTLETIELVEKLGAKVVAVACLIDRRHNKTNNIFSVPLISLLQLSVQTFEPTNIPPHLANIPAIKPGSRPSQT